MNYLIRLKDGEEEHLVNTTMLVKESIVSFYLQDVQIWMHFPLLNVLSIKEFETTYTKQTTAYIP